MLKQYVAIIFALLLWFGSGGAISAGAITPFPSLSQTEKRININTASAEELMQLPGIGPGYAARIIAHSQKHGVFKRPQDVIIVRGFSAKRYCAFDYGVDRRDEGQCDQSVEVIIAPITPPPNLYDIAKL